MLESEWQTLVLIPFFTSYEDLITNYKYTSSNPNLIHYLLSRDDLEPKLHFVDLSANNGLTMDTINEYPNKKWDWNSVSRNPGITVQDVINHPEYPWEWIYGVSYNPNLTISMILLYPDKEWDWYGISRNPGITVQDVINHPEYPWYWNEVFGNKAATDNSLYVNNQLGRVLLVSMLDEYNNDTSTPLDNTLPVLCNDYHLSCILPYM